VFRNDEFPPSLETSDEWIRTRTGIRERRICAADETVATLGILAASQALEAAGVAPSEIDLIICATLTPDMIVPSTACLIQQGLGTGPCAAFDLNTACSGFLYAFAVADQFIQSGTCRHVLVVGGDTMSRIVDFSDRNTCILFGDGAGAVVLSADDTANTGGCWFRLRADGRMHESVLLGGASKRTPADIAPLNQPADNLDFLRMNGREVYKFAVTTIVKLVNEALSENGLTIDDIALIVPHQVNQRILESACDQLGIPISKMFINLDRYGNTSAGSVPIALDEAIRAGRLKTGDRILMMAFGGGLTWASAMMTV